MVMEKVITEKTSFISKKDNEKVFVYTFLKPKYDFENKKFDGYEHFNVITKVEYNLLDQVEVAYSKEKRKYEIISKITSF